MRCMLFYAGFIVMFHPVQPVTGLDAVVVAVVDGPPWFRQWWSLIRHHAMIHAGFATVGTSILNYPSDFFLFMCQYYSMSLVSFMYLEGNLLNYRHSIYWTLENVMKYCVTIHLIPDGLKYRSSYSIFNGRGYIPDIKRLKVSLENPA